MSDRVYHLANPEVHGTIKQTDVGTADQTTLVLFDSEVGFSGAPGVKKREWLCAPELLEPVNPSLAARFWFTCRRIMIWLDGHHWKNRSPYARKCLRCGRNENVYSDSYDGAGWWEAVYPLAHSPQLCRKGID